MDHPVVLSSETPSRHHRRPALIIDERGHTYELTYSLG
jgi:hypothetical protein